MRALILGFVLFLSVSVCDAQWIPQTSGTTRNLEGVCFTDANTGTVVGWYGTILRTTNAGLTWESQGSGTPYGLYGVSFTDLNTGTVVGDNGVVLRTTNGGATWVSQSSGTHHTLRSVSFADASTGIAVGDNGAILRTTNGGVTWTNQSVWPTYLNGVQLINADTGTVVGRSGMILRTTNGGESWTSRSIGTTRTLNSVSFTDVNTGTVVGDTILRTTNGGATWFNPSSESIGGRGVSFSDSNTGTVVGGRGLGTRGQSVSAIHRTTTGGDTWTDQSCDEAPVLHAVCFINANTGVAVGEGGTILRTTNGGVTWVEGESKQIRETPSGFGLEQNYPNPFNPTTEIGMRIAKGGLVSLKVFDVLDREVATLVNEVKQPGVYTVRWDANGVASGVYLYRLTAGSFVETKKMLVLK